MIIAGILGVNVWAQEPSLAQLKEKLAQLKTEIATLEDQEQSAHEELEALQQLPPPETTLPIGPGAISLKNGKEYVCNVHGYANGVFFVEDGQGKKMKLSVRKVDYVAFRQEGRTLDDIGKKQQVRRPTSVHAQKKEASDDCDLEPKGVVKKNKEFLRGGRQGNVIYPKEYSLNLELKVTVHNNDFYHDCQGMRVVAMLVVVESSDDESYKVLRREEWKDIQIPRNTSFEEMITGYTEYWDESWTKGGFQYEGYAIFVYDTDNTLLFESISSGHLNKTKDTLENLSQGSTFRR